jgi:hypothetical protein
MRREYGAPVPVRRQAIVALALLPLGLVLVALPDAADDRLVEFGPGHGPSTVDLVGLVPLAVGSVWLEVLVVWRLPDVVRRLRLGARSVLAVGLAVGLVGGFGLGALVASVTAERWWWGVGAVLTGAALLVLVMC